MKPVSLLIIMLLMLSACAGMKKAPDVKPLTLNGKFKNHNAMFNFYLWNLIETDIRPQDTCRACYVKLKVVDKHTISASLMRGDSILKTFTREGKVKEHESIFVQSHFKIDPKWVLIWGWHLGKYQLHITDKGNLVAEDDRGGMLALIIMPLGAADNNSGCDFERILD